MKITVLFFAALKDVAGTSEGEYEVPQGATPEQVADLLLGFHSNVLYAVNDDLAAKDRPLTNGDRLALIPPMAGG